MADACYCDDGDPPIFYRKTEVAQAREPHPCYECGAAILPGESYERVHALWDRHDGPQTVHTCAWCIDLREYMVAHVPCFCVLHGGLFEYVTNEMDWNPEARDALKPEVDAMVNEIRARPSLRDVLREVSKNG